MKRILPILLLLLTSCVEMDNVQPCQSEVTGTYRVVSGALLPIGSTVIFKERHMHFNHVGIPYTACNDTITYGTEGVTKWHYSRYVWGLVLNNEIDTAMLLRQP